LNLFRSTTLSFKTEILNEWEFYILFGERGEKFSTQFASDFTRNYLEDKLEKFEWGQE
jgi:hypothetical protein